MVSPYDLSNKMSGLLIWQPRAPKSIKNGSVDLQLGYICCHIPLVKSQAQLRFNGKDSTRG
jgi:hypothetical protein